MNKLRGMYEHVVETFLGCKHHDKEKFLNFFLIDIIWKQCMANVIYGPFLPILIMLC